MTQLLAIDIGGTRIKYGLVADGRIVTIKNIASLAGQGAAALVQQVTGLVQQVCSRQAVDGIALSSAGQVDIDSGVITYAGATIPGYTGTDWYQALTQIAPGVPCSVENDVNCALLAELKPSDRYTTMLTIGTGIGGAMALGQRILHGAGNAMGEVGYLPLEGQTFESYAATAALVREVAALYPDQDIDGFAVFKLEKQAANVKAVVDQYFEHLARGLMTVMMVFPSDRLIIGGGVSENVTFVPRVIEHLQPLLPPWLSQLTIDSAAHGNRAGMMGAVRHWQQIYQS